MKDASSKRKKNVGIGLGIWSVTFCMAAGLILKMRPLVILERSGLSFAVSVMLGYFLVSVIEKYTIVKKPLPPKESEESEEAEGEQEATADEIPAETDKGE